MMGLKKAFTDKFGNVQAESYWKIISINLDYVENRANVIVGGYKNKAARDTLRANIAILNYEFSGETFSMFGDEENHRSNIYTHLKTLSTFENAEDL